MAIKNLYDVYDMESKEYILDHVTESEIKDFFHDPKLTCANKASSRNVYRRQYLIGYAGDDIRKWFRLDGSIIRMPGASKNDISPMLNSEWERTCRAFRKVEWVKTWEPGVRILGR